MFAPIAWFFVLFTAPRLSLLSARNYLDTFEIMNPHLRRERRWWSVIGSNVYIFLNYRGQIVVTQLALFTTLNEKWIPSELLIIIQSFFSQIVVVSVVQIFVINSLQDCYYFVFIEINILYLNRRFQNDLIPNFISIDLTQ
jgi:hypothetical protein